MRRAPLVRRAALQRRAPLRQTAARSTRRVRIAPMSVRQRARPSSPHPRLRATVMMRDQDRCRAPGCYDSAVDVHHVLPRSRGGTVLDAWALACVADGTFDWRTHVAHLVALCRASHGRVHGEPAWARDVGLMADGCVVSLSGGSPLYRGRHVELGRLWGSAVDVGECQP